MSAEGKGREVLEVEVERMPLVGEDSHEGDSESTPLDTARRVHRALGPVLAGILVDVLDAATMTPPVGLVLGLTVGYYLARQLGLVGSGAQRLALVIGVYCAVPGTLALPLGTLVGAFVRVRQVLSAAVNSSGPG